MAEENACPTSLLVFADDWGRHPSSCQHLVRHLLDRYGVCWVNTIGTRPPHFDLATLARGLEKLRQWTRPGGATDPLPVNLRVLNPHMWPWFSSAFSRKLNRLLLTRQLGSLLGSLPDPPVAVTTLPIVADLMDSLPVRRWVYYCVDDFGQWPGLDQAALKAMEKDLVARADRVIAVSDTLREKIGQMGKRAYLLTHGTEPDFWKDQSDDSPVPQLKALQRPLILFWGVIDRRMDVALIRQLAGDLAHGTIVLLGPQADPDPALETAHRVVHLPPVPFAQLPRFAREAAVLVMPYGDLPVTRAMQPLKLKEYLATGKPVVARDLPATRTWADCLDVIDRPETFSGAVCLRLATGLPEDQRRARLRLAGEGWAEKARSFERWVFHEE